MTADRWARIHDLFELCLDQPPESRTSFLEAQPVDPDVRSEVQKLLDQDRAAGGFMDESPDLVKELRTGPRAQFSPGERLANRFELLRLIGRGGMGEVYAALDVDLEEQVAVKVLHADLLGDTGATQRFRRELQLARKVTHANVCRLFDLGRHSTPSGDVFFLTMELVEGETLADRLRRTGPLKVDEAHPIVEQILNGLSAAHQAGIIHRDLKPSNIMLTGDRAVIMDFGLARRDSALTGQSLTSSGKVLGTLLYMAPEQLQGQPVTERTDIYALGLLMYELTTGQRPFGPADSVASVLTRLTQVPAPPTTLAPDIPRNWSRTITAALELDPQHRPATAQQLLDHLQGSGPRRQLRISRRQIVTAAAIPTAAVSLYWAVPRLLTRNGPARGVSSIYVTDISNTTGDQRLDGSSMVLKSHLSQSAHFTILSEDRVQALMTQMRKFVSKSPIAPEAARELALRNGPGTVVVYGSLAALGSVFALSIRIEQPGSRPDEVLSSWSKQFNSGGTQDLSTQMRSVATWVRECLGEPSIEIEKQNRSTADISTSSWDALQLYGQAREARARGETRAAELYLAESLKIDPQFVSALRERADLLTSEGNLAQGFFYWKQAIHFAQAKRLTNEERFRIEALYYDDIRDFARAETVYAAWATRYPNNYVPHFYRAAMLTWLGRDDEAVRNWETSFRISKYAPTAEALGKLALLRDDVERALQWLAEIRKIGNLRAEVSLQSRIHVHRARYREALISLERLTSIKDYRARAHAAQLQASLYSDLNKPDEAANLLAREISVQRGEGLRPFVESLSLALSVVMLQQGEVKAATRLALDCLAEASSPLSIQKLARIFRLLSRPKLVTSLLSRLPASPGIPLFDHTRKVIQGEAAFARKDFTLAQQSFEDAASIIPAAYMPPIPLWEVLVASGSRQLAASVLVQPCLSTAYVWRNMELLWPGAWRHTLSLYNSVGAAGSDLINARATLDNLRL